MKISDLQGYELPQDSAKYKIEIFKQREKIPVFKRLKQSFIDFSIASFARFFLGFVIFKLLLLQVPADFHQKVMETQVTEDQKAFILLLVENNIHWYTLIAVVSAFFLGSIYYIAMLSFGACGTLGMKWSSLTVQTKKGNKPTVLQSFAWYYIKIMYPTFILLALIIFFVRGLNVPFIICGILAVIFSDVATTIFGFQPLYEKISGMKITVRK